MKFKDYKYERIDIEKLKIDIKDLIKAIETAEDYAAYNSAFKKFCKIEDHIETMVSICEIRHTVDTRDEFYSKENDFFDENTPVIQSLKNDFSKALLASRFVEELKKEIPEVYFMQIENSLKVCDEKIINELKEENKLCSEYQSLIASAQIEFEGETYTLASLGSKMESSDRETRKASMQAYWGWLEEHEDSIADIYDKMVKVRDKMAKKLGYKNFVEMGYVRMNRFDYDANDVANYRKQILKDVVPVTNRLYKKQQERLGYDKLNCYDEKFEFTSGNPTPKHSKDEMLESAKKMYHELSPKTGKFFDFMLDHELLDLEAKPGKAAGGYCTTILDYNSPFIFSNFNGTSGDVDVLTHEAGHAFQTFSSMGIRPAGLVWPTYESCEIHSMSMEFFTHPWMKLFFEEDTDKYYYLHVAAAVKFLPYGILIDHFQHEVYEHPEMTPAERKAVFRKLEKEYLPHKDYSSIPFLEEGSWWYRQPHVFLDPFYYVDYTLAQVCALQFLQRILENDEKAFDDYYGICNVGGTLTFRKMVEKANLKVPFNDGCLSDVMKKIEEYLNGFDDKKM